MDEDKKRLILQKALGLLSMLSQGIVPSNIAKQAEESFNEMGDLFVELFPDSKVDEND
jgi:hypothetical protein